MEENKDIRSGMGDRLGRRPSRTPPPPPIQRKKRIYLSGKMQGLPDHGFPLFNQMAGKLREEGFEVINPAENKWQETWEAYMKVDIAALVTCDFIAVLDNWKDSRGAKLEVYIARQLGIGVVRAADLKEVKDEQPISILLEADSLVNGDRQNTYGHPYDDYKCTVEMFNVWMQKKYPNGYKQLTPEDGVMYMVFVKLSREANMSKRDNLVDAAGYLQCLDMINAKRKSLGMSELSKESALSTILTTLVNGGTSTCMSFPK